MILNSAAKGKKKQGEKSIYENFFSETIKGDWIPVIEELKELTHDRKNTIIAANEGPFVITDKSILYYIHIEEWPTNISRKTNIPFKNIVTIEKESKYEHNVWSIFNPSTMSAPPITFLYISYKDDKNQMQTFSLTSSDPNTIEKAYNILSEKLKPLNKIDKKEN